MNIAYNMDCMEGLKQYPDKYFDLAIVDPPYGDGSQNVQVERDRIITDSVGGLTNTSLSRTGGTWAAKYEKNHKLGLRPRRGLFQRTF